MYLTGKRESVLYGGEEQSQGRKKNRGRVQEDGLPAASANCSEKQVFSSQVQEKLLF